MVFIGGEDQGGHVDILEAMPNIVVREDAQPIHVAESRGGAGEQEEAVDLVAVRVRGMQA